MEKKYITLAVLLALTAWNTAAWGCETHRYICEQAVYSVWGSTAVERCLVYNKTFQTYLCEQLQSAGQKVSDTCILETDKGVFLHPALIPYMLFNDSEEHYDYSQCPVRGAANRALICGNPEVTPALDRSEEWFTRSINAGGLCTRIAYFCIASNYYGDSRFKLNNVRNLETCYGDVELEVDKRVRSNASWRVDEYCSFDGWIQRAGRTVRERHSQEFTFSSGDVEGIVENLSARAAYIKTFPFVSEVAAQETGTTTTTVASGVTESVVTTQPVNETMMMYETLMEQTDIIFNETLSIFRMLGELDESGGEQTRGRGNVVIKTFMVVVLLAGFGIGAVVFYKTELKRRKKMEGSKTHSTPQHPTAGGER